MAIKGSLFKIYRGEGETLLEERCQLDATLTVNVETETEDPCKPSGAEAGTNDIPWDEVTPVSRNWEVSFSQREFLDAIAETDDTILDDLIGGDVYLGIEVRTTSGSEVFNKVYAGQVIVTSAVLNAPAQGLASTDYTLTGTGALTVTKVPIASPVDGGV